ncbi:uncharacterized protein LOC143224237 isoform X1 [Tachypleus tridentatus]|uniref:uncharacterized protein LOC143224237 isoform X1 n=1 Tax=Tachypleus tridentatus TaxID=6853 RepID=UPI003FD0F255
MTETCTDIAQLSCNRTDDGKKISSILPSKPLSWKICQVCLDLLLCCCRKGSLLRKKIASIYWMQSTLRFPTIPYIPLQGSMTKLWMKYLSTTLSCQMPQI